MAEKNRKVLYDPSDGKNSIEAVLSIVIELAGNNCELKKYEFPEDASKPTVKLTFEKRPD